MLERGTGREEEKSPTIGGKNVKIKPYNRVGGDCFPQKTDQPGKGGPEKVKKTLFGRKGVNFPKSPYIARGAKIEMQRRCIGEGVKRGK